MILTFWNTSKFKCVGINSFVYSTAHCEFYLFITTSLKHTYKLSDTLKKKVSHNGTTLLNSLVHKIRWLMSYSCIDCAFKTWWVSQFPRFVPLPNLFPSTTTHAIMHIMFKIHKQYLSQWVCLTNHAQQTSGAHCSSIYSWRKILIVGKTARYTKCHNTSSRKKYFQVFNHLYYYTLCTSRIPDTLKKSLLF